MARNHAQNIEITHYTKYLRQANLSNENEHLQEFNESCLFPISSSTTSLRMTMHIHHQQSNKSYGKNFITKKLTSAQSLVLLIDVL